LQNDGFKTGEKDIGIRLIAVSGAGAGATGNGYSRPCATALQ
jgi:hypothetical protein